MVGSSSGFMYSVIEMIRFLGLLGVEWKKIAIIDNSTWIWHTLHITTKQTETILAIPMYIDTRKHTNNHYYYYFIFFFFFVCRLFCTFYSFNDFFFVSFLLFVLLWANFCYLCDTLFLLLLLFYCNEFQNKSVIISSVPFQFEFMLDERRHS